MASNLRQKLIKNVSGLSIIDTGVTPNKAIIMPKPSATVVQAGIEEIINQTRNELGERVVDSTTIDANQPTLQFTLPGFIPEAVFMRLGKRPTAGTVSFPVERTILVTSGNRTYAGASAGQMGFGMSADQATSQAWAFDEDGIASELTRVDTASFNDTDDTFSQGANGAYQFASNLINSTVFYKFPFEGSGLETSEATYDTFDVAVTFLTRQLWLGRIELPSAQVDLSAGDINLGSEAQLTVRSVYDGSSCQPIRVKFLRQLTVAC